MKRYKVTVSDAVQDKLGGSFVLHVAGERHRFDCLRDLRTRVIGLSDSEAAELEQYGYTVEAVLDTATKGTQNGGPKKKSKET